MGGRADSGLDHPLPAHRPRLRAPARTPRNHRLLGHDPHHEPPSGTRLTQPATGCLRFPNRLLDQLGALVDGFRCNTGTRATLRIDGTSRPLPAEASLALFRGAQEALTNISRYAPGATTAVTVSYQADRTVVTIEDHARPSATSPGPSAEPGSPLLADVGGGHGLTAMRERAQRAGGIARAGPTADGWLV